MSARRYTYGANSNWYGFEDDGDPFGYELLRDRGVSREHSLLEKIIGMQEKQKGKRPEDPKEEEDKSCVVCMDAPRDSALVPCGHATFCADCAMSLREKPCPICRTMVQTTIKIYT